MLENTRRRSRAAAIALSVAAGTVLSLSACAPISLPTAQESSSASGSASSAGHQNTEPAREAGSTPATGTAQPEEPSGLPGVPRITNDYYDVLGPAVRQYSTGKLRDTVQYCELDELSRPGCAYAELTSATVHIERQQERQDISIDPPGWGGNEEVIIPENPGVKDSRSYSGWMFNRSHLVADSLGGDATAENLITGTRTQNVGSTQQAGQFAGGMAYAELAARTYLATSGAYDCPLYYAATPNYNGDELIPRSVDVDIQTCDQSIDQHIVVYNTAEGYEIDYAAGGFTDFTSSN